MCERKERVRGGYVRKERGLRVKEKRVMCEGKGKVACEGKEVMCERKEGYVKGKKGLCVMCERKERVMCEGLNEGKERGKRGLCVKGKRISCERNERAGYTLSFPSRTPSDSTPLLYTCVCAEEQGQWLCS